VSRWLGGRERFFFSSRPLVPPHLPLTACSFSSPPPAPPAAGVHFVIDSVADLMPVIDVINEAMAKGVTPLSV
jgi:hypothetical protein